MKTICLIISFLWIGLGTFVQLSSYPAYNYLGFDYNSFSLAGRSVQKMR